MAKLFSHYLLFVTQGEYSCSTGYFGACQNPEGLQCPALKTLDAKERPSAQLLVSDTKNQNGAGTFPALM